MAEDPQIWDEGSREQEQPLTPFTYPRLPGTEAQRGQLSPGTYREDTAVWSSSRQPGDLTSLPEVTLDTCMQECKSFSLLFGISPQNFYTQSLTQNFCLLLSVRMRWAVVQTASSETAEGERPLGSWLVTSNWTNTLGCDWLLFFHRLLPLSMIRQNNKTPLENGFSGQKRTMRWITSYTKSQKYLSYKTAQKIKYFE